ncbi:hypothetical protein KEM09_00990 [Carboxylicivirga mesophila]|uniref:O-antigen translocase n=1 Tax=Carboxylicivirga mesophila TaxID=1166478 RepID=A0ABS5K4M0_9BACT|nr:hypothetical protein [Carboxylicivirga mesophila]MBS2209959.1 hypothetical protein [Carboxylicivirga mesophila]
MFGFNKVKNIIREAIRGQYDDFLNISLKNSIHVAIRFVLGIAQIKFMSIILGPAGLAILGQFSSIIQATSNLTGGISHGATKLSSAYRNSPLRSNLIIVNVIMAIIAISIISGLFIYLFSAQLSHWLFKSDEYIIYVKLSWFIIIATGLTNALLAILSGLKLYSNYIKLNIAFVISSFIVLIAGMYLWQINGAMSALYIAAFFNLSIIIYTCKPLLKNALKSVRFSKYIHKRLAGFATMLIVSSCIGPITSIIIRNIITDSFSIEITGWWEGLSRLSNTLFNISVSTLGLFYIPKISEIHNPLKLHAFIKGASSIAMPIITFGICLIFITKHYIVYLLFSQDFEGMDSLFLYQNIGDVFRIFSWFLAITFIIKEKIRIFIFSELTMALLHLILAYTIIPNMDIDYATLPYMIKTITYFIICVLLYRRYIFTRSV